MTRDELGKIIMALSATYDNFPVTEKAQFDIWYEMLRDLDYRVTMIAVKELIATSVFPPKIAEIRRGATQILHPTQTSTEAWEEVTRAVRRHGSYGEAEALAQMSPIARRVVKSMGYRELCLSENQMADRAHFLKLFEVLRDKEVRRLQIGEPLAEAIEDEREREKDKVLQLTNKIGNKL